MPSKPVATEELGCKLAEILQYECTMENKRSALVCYPLSRVFRICPGLPAVEITAFLRLDERTGNMVIPNNVNAIMPKTRPWRDIRPI